MNIPLPSFKGPWLQTLLTVAIALAGGAGVLFAAGFTACRR